MRFVRLFKVYVRADPLDSDSRALRGILDAGLVRSRSGRHDVATNRYSTLGCRGRGARPQQDMSRMHLGGGWAASRRTGDGAGCRVESR